MSNFRTPGDYDVPKLLRGAAAVCYITIGYQYADDSGGGAPVGLA